MKVEGSNLTRYGEVVECAKQGEKKRNREENGIDQFPPHYSHKPKTDKESPNNF